MSSHPPLLVFDLDGTLVDSNRDLIPALNFTTAHDGIAPVSTEAVGHVVGRGVVEMLKSAYKLDGKTLSQRRQEELLPLYLDYYESHIADHTTYFDGLLDALDRLSGNGWRFAVCTNKLEHLARKLLNELGEASRFSVITGGDTFEFRKPDGRHVLETIRLAGGDPARAIMVGDSINDIDAAKSAGIPVIAVDFGYTDIPVDQLAPDVIISSFDRLPQAAAGLSSRR